MAERLWSKRFLHVALCLFFFGVPLLATRVMFFSVLDVREEIAREIFQEQLNQRLWQITRGMQPRLQVEHLTRIFLEEVRRQPLTMSALERVQETISRDSGIAFQTFVFDASGSLRNPEMNPPAENEMFEGLWRVLSGKEIWETIHIRPRMENYLGMQFLPDELMTHPKVPVSVLGRRGKGFLYWYPLDPQESGSLAGLSFFLSIQDLPPASSLLRRLNSLNADPGLVVVVEEGGKPPVFITDGGSRIQAEQAYRERQGSVGIPASNPWIWTSFRLDDVRLLAGQPWDPGSLQLLRRLATHGFYVVGLLLILLGAIGLEHQSRFFFPIRLKIAGLFLYLTLVAATGLGALGFRQMNERREVLIAESLKGGQEILGALDADFTEERLRVLQEFRTMKTRVELKPEREALAAMVRESYLNWLDVRRLDASVLFATEPKEDKELMTLVPGFLARKLIEQFLQERLGGQKPFPPQPSDVFIAKLLESPVIGGNRMFNRPDVLHRVRFGHLDLFWFWDLFTRTDLPLATFMANRPVGICIQEYLRKRLKSRFSREQGGFRVFAFSTQSGEPVVAGNHIPPELRDVVEKIRLAEEAVSGVLTLPEGRVLVAGMPGKLLLGHILVCLYPYGEIDRQIRRMGGDLALLILASLAVALLLGGILARLFIYPISELTKGVQALHDRNPSVRIPDLGGDEFGELGRTFNQTIEDIGEMLFAQTVQARLIPTSVSPVPGIEIELVNVMASDLGGDYCDCLPLPDGRVLIIIGDVTGHGVSSSLVMAMAKAVVFVHSRGVAPIRQLLEEIDQLLFRALKKKKFMTCFAATIDPVSGLGICSNAGHPYPLITRADGSYQFLEMIRLPLGMSKKTSPCQEMPIELRPGDLLLLYTDGLVEMLSPAGEQWGYERLRAFFLEHRHLPLPELKRKVLNEARQFTGTDILDDDLTFLMIRKTG